ncbi:MAG: hypothetical protein JOZ62_03195 [Acidobacteriaceae bacterium]|nr:hypothetical protein [Acidobacteriaceae bacterium]
METDLQRGHCGRPSGRTGHELVLLSRRQDRFPFPARCINTNAVSPLRKGKSVEFYAWPMKRPASMTCWCRGADPLERAVPLSQLDAINPGESTREAIRDWRYWLMQSCRIQFAQGSRNSPNSSLDADHWHE